MIEGWLIYNREDFGGNRFFAGRLISEGAKRGLEIRLLFADEIHAGIQDSRLCLMMEDSGRLPAFVINRTRDWLLARCFELAGCRAYNSSEAASVCNDKIESHLLAARLGLPQVDMVFCRNNPDSIIKHGLNYPVVVKSPYGHGGGEVFLANNEDELLTSASRLKCGRVIIQRLCGRPGEDVRVYALGGRILTAVKRRSILDFRANLSLGGGAEPYELNEDGKRMAERILQALRPDYAGIDFILDENGGLLFNELEDAVGSRALYKLGSHDAAGLYIGYISETLGSIKT